ncbi:hypothetical protein Cni_G06429 [Canna indica]|uniref:RING-type domain-containing protein n=1 Tax=Canna indica TaxID=4628 RepID=A0AAQ3K089_9LILI|nr:hypothetical protein Cni_G06429 [Canna indica]
MWLRTVGKAAQELAAHALLFCFTLFLALKIDGRTPYTWWTIFVPLWLFHAVVARGRFSLPAPSLPHDRHWAPCHAVVAAPLLISFELLLCIYLHSIYVSAEHAINLKIVFLPLLALEIVILVDNVRMCRALMPGDEENMSNEDICETLPYFWIAISMVFLITATVFTVLKQCGDVGRLGWWYLFVNLGIAECFSFLVCTKWFNPMIHIRSYYGEACLSSSSTRYPDWNNNPMEDYSQDRLCSLQNIGGHMMKVPLVLFQVLLCMRLQGTPRSAQHIPILVLFLPLFILQGAGILYAVSRLVEKVILLLHNGTIDSRYLIISSRIHGFFAFLHRGSRFLGWWSINDGRKEEQCCLFPAESAGYNTFSGYPPEIIKKMAKKDLIEEVWKLQAALGEQAEITKFTQHEYQRLQKEKVICRICHEAEVCMVLLPCQHRILCKSCSEKCVSCPICQTTIKEWMPVYDV